MQLTLIYRYYDPKNQSKFIIEIETPKLMSKISMLRIRLV